MVLAGALGFPVSKKLLEEVAKGKAMNKVTKGNRKGFLSGPVLSICLPMHRFDL